MQIQLKKISKSRAFTLIEVMVVVVILAILAAIIVPRIMDRPEQAKIVAAKQDILAIQNALDLYKLDNGSFPTQAQGLKALVTKPTLAPIPQNYPISGYLQKLPQDPWGHPFHYKNPGKHGNVDVFTYGKNNKPGKDEIGNWTIK